MQQCVVRLMLLAKSLKGEEVARQLIMCLSNQIGITSNQLVAAMRDSASTNNVAIQTLKMFTLDTFGCIETAVYELTLSKTTWWQWH